MVQTPGPVKGNFYLLLTTPKKSAKKKRLNGK